MNHVVCGSRRDVCEALCCIGGVRVLLVLIFMAFGLGQISRQATDHAEAMQALRSLAEERACHTSLAQAALAPAVRLASSEDCDARDEACLLLHALACGGCAPVDPGSSPRPDRDPLCACPVQPCTSHSSV